MNDAHRSGSPGCRDRRGFFPRRLRGVARLCVALSSWAAALACPCVARAEPSTAERAIAEQLFDRGRAQLAVGEVSSACDSFAESQRLDPGTGTLLNLAACHEQEGKLASAWVEFREAVAALRRENRPDRLRYALDRLAVIEPKLAYLTIVVPESPQGHAPVVRLDGKELGPAAWSVAIPVDAGWHEAVAQSSRGGPWRATLKIDNGQRRTVTIPAQVSSEGLELADPGAPARGTIAAVGAPGEPLPAPALVPPPPPRDESQHAATGFGGRRAAAAVIGGLGLGALGVGTYYGLHAASLWRGRNDACPMDVCTPAGQRLGEQAGSAATVATWTLAGGAVAVGAAVLLWFLPGGASPQSGPPSAGKVTVSLRGLSFGATTAVSLGGAF